MDWSAIIVAAITALSAISVAIVNIWGNRQRKNYAQAAVERQEQETAERKERQKIMDERHDRQENLLMMMLKGLRAQGALTNATALAVKNGKTNGEMEEGLKQYLSYETEYGEFVDKLGAESFLK